MTKVAYHCSHEQFSPKALFDYAIQAERAGFKHLSCSDHFAPWSELQGQSGNAWCWMGAILAATNLTCGSVTAPGYRYNPGIVAQMAATLEQMFPGRFWLALGSGEYLNEQFTGLPWPAKQVRNERLKECIEIIRKLLRGEEVNYQGYLVMETARLYSLSKNPIPILGAALSEETAKYLGGLTDGLITASGSIEGAKQLIHAYQSHAKEKKQLILKLDVSYAANKDKAIHDGWEQWRPAMVGSPLASELRYPRHFEKASQFMTKEQFAEKILITTKLSEIEEALHQFGQLGFDQINIHNVNKDQSTFIDEMSKLLKTGRFE